MAIIKNKIDMTLQDLLTLKLQALYDVETEQVKALPTMAEHADDEGVKMAFEEHLHETEVHVERLEQALSLLDEKPSKKIKVEAIRGMIEDGEWITKHVRGPEALDTSLMASAQYVEQYEIAGYSTAVEWADFLDFPEISGLLTLTLEEEKAASEKLTELTEAKMNEFVVGAEDAMTEEDDSGIDDAGMTKSASGKGDEEEMV
jgi:ferritin-like metal-binding protein YciE